MTILRSFLILLTLIQVNEALVTPQPKRIPQLRTTAQQTLASTVLISTLIVAPPTAVYADTASDTVSSVISQLQDSQGNVAATFEAYEKVAAIITEGAGVGGSVDAKGVALDRGYVADEDTAIYNPGLALLTETEKERLVRAVIDAKKAATDNNWNEDTQLGYEFLREKLDPYHVTELRGYLGIFPYWTAVVYLGTLAIQQVARSIFPIAYFGGVLLIVAPIIALILAGP